MIRDMNILSRYTIAEKRKALNKAVKIARREGWYKQMLYPELSLIDLIRKMDVSEFFLRPLRRWDK